MSDRAGAQLPGRYGRAPAVFVSRKSCGIAFRPTAISSVEKREAARDKSVCALVIVRVALEGGRRRSRTPLAPGTPDARLFGR